MTGRGRGESKHVGKIDEGDPAVIRDRDAQLEAARQLGIPESQVPIRGRGGFRQPELRTIPSTATQITNQNMTNVKQVDILANFVQMTPMANRVIQMYRVEFEPQIESTSTLRFLFKTAAGKLFQRPPIYDGMFECRSAQELPQKVSPVTIVDPRDSGQTEYKVTFTKTGTVTFGPESLRIYNMHMKEFLRTLGFYQPQTGVYVHERLATEINPELMMMRGYRTSANIHDGNRMLMNLEATHKLMQRKNVLAIMGQIRQRQPPNLKAALDNELVGKLVVSSYDKRAYRIEEVKTTMKPTDTFEKDGEQISYIDYYQRYKSVTVQNTSQPLLLVVPNNQRRREEVQRELHLIPELCNIAGLTEVQRQDNRLKMDLIRASQVKPTERVSQMRKFLEDFNNRAEIQSKLSEWGYNYDKDAVKLKAFVLASTRVAYGDMCNRSKDQWQPANPESADIRVDGLAVSKKINKMAIICCRNDLRDKQQIMNALKQGFDQVRLQVANVLSVDVQEGDRPADYINAIKKLPEDVECAVVIMNRQNKERYDAIKKVATTERGLITQVVTARLMTDQRKARSAATKIAIQVAAKVGGEPWWADIPMRDTMICGYDTYHDTAKRGRSFGAFLATLNNNYSRWWSKADSHDTLQELSSQVASNMVEAVKQYVKFNNGAYPGRIVIYRDGVGDGQLEHVFNVELKLIRQALNEAQGSKKINLTMIIVSKRIGARFYMRAREGFDNPPPGTVIDHTVTRAERYDFYLVSQSTRQGSITPTYYNIICDEAGFPPDVHQKLAYKMCLLYYNWAGTVRVPAPCQYAHKLALLCGEHLHAQPNSVMDDKLHFL